MKIVTVIPTYNRKNEVVRVLKLLYNQTHFNHELEIVLVIDGSTDGTLEVINNLFPDVHVVLGSGNWWYTKSMNEGFRYALELNPNFILALNDDIEFNPNYLQSLIHAYNIVESNSIIGSVAISYEQPHRLFLSGAKKIIWSLNKTVMYIKPYTLVNPRNLTGIYSSVTLPGRGTLFPAHLLEDLNYFDESFVQYFSDTDFFLRAAKKGYNIYISWDAQILSHTEKTDQSSLYLKPKFNKFISSFFNKYSRRYIPGVARYLIRHGGIRCFPSAFITFFIANFIGFLKHKLK